MRLTCPTCGAEYEIADAMVPAAGRHVQCTACHARWFVRGAVARQDSEDEIMQRLEARSHLRAVPTPARTPAPEPTPEPTPEPIAKAPPPDAVESPSLPAEPSPRVETTAPTPAATPPSAPSAPVVPGPRPSPRAVPAKPAERPMVASDNLALRPAPRLDLGAEPEALPAPETPPSRFARGLVVALVLAGLALSIYTWRAEIAAGLPAAAPALDVYGRAVDDLRIELDRQIDGLRD